MPYHYYNRMADADVEAIIAFLRSLEPVDHETGENDPTGLELPAPPGPRAGVTAPDQTDRVAYGEYLTTAVLACGACHTPQPNGSEPEPEVYLYMAGGQPFEGEWGVVYAGNLTPDLETGLGAWNDDDFVLAVMAGELPDGRETLVMPWEAYAALTSDDIQAVLAYLRSLPPIDSPVPLAELNEGYAHYTRDDVPARSSPFMSALAVLVLILLLGLGVLMTIRQYRYARALREMEWRGTFPLTPSDREDEEGDQDQPPPGP
jgi:mono/diheme cytochrome c family protein